LWPQGCRFAAPHQVGSDLEYTSGDQINVASRQPVAHAVHPRHTDPHWGPGNAAPPTRQNFCAEILRAGSTKLTA